MGKKILKKMYEFGIGMHGLLAIIFPIWAITKFKPFDGENIYYYILKILVIFCSICYFLFVIKTPAEKLEELNPYNDKK